MNIFQTILLIIFGAAIIIGLFVFAGILPGFRSPQGGAAGTIEIWGVFPAGAMKEVVQDINKKYEENFSVVYKVFSPEEINRQLVEALAAGKGPQAVILPHELILKNEKLWSKIPTESVPERQFRDTYIDGASVFMVDSGYLALPLVVDPLVMYFNKDLYTNAGLVTVPKTWVEFLSNTPKLTRLNSVGNNFEESAIALGTFSNIPEAKDILSLLLIQSGANPVLRDSTLQAYRSLLDKKLETGETLTPSSAALQFFLQFADPGKSAYTWNRSLPQAFESFTGDHSANYLALSSRFLDIKEANPHLNFDVAGVPQRDSKNKKVFGRFYGIAVPKSSNKSQTGIQAAIVLSSAYYQEKLSSALGLPATSRTLLAKTNPDPYQTVFKEAAVTSRAWLDVVPDDSFTILKTMADRVYSGELKVEEAVSAASRELQGALDRNK